MSNMSEMDTEIRTGYGYVLDAMREAHKTAQGGRLDIVAITTHVSRSGMSRTIWFGFQNRGRTYDLTGMLRAMGLGNRPRSDAHGIAISGCGMDFHADTVARLSEYVFNDSRALYCHRV